MKHIKLFVEATGLHFEDGEIGFGRKCVGIVNKKTESYLAYQAHDNDFNEIMRHDVAMGSAPEDAYHKGPYLAVLYDGTEEGKQKAISQLDEWIEKIMAAHYEISSYKETNTISAMLAGGAINQKCLTGGVSFGRFTEIF